MFVLFKINCFYLRIKSPSIVNNVKKMWDGDFIERARKVTG